MGTPDHFTCLLRNRCAGQEAKVSTRHRTMDWFQIGEGVRQGCLWSLCLFNLYTEYIVWNAELGEAQAGIKISGRNINNLRDTDDTTLMAESEEELKSLLMKVKEESEKTSLRLNIQKTKIMASYPIALWQISGETMEAVRDRVSYGTLSLKCLREHWRASLVAQLVKNLPERREIWVWSGRGPGNTLQCSCLENPHGQRSLVGCSPWVAKSRMWLSN